MADARTGAGNRDQPVAPGARADPRCPGWQGVWTVGLLIADALLIRPDFLKGLWQSALAVVHFEDKQDSDVDRGGSAGAGD